MATAGSFCLGFTILRSDRTREERAPLTAQPEQPHTVAELQTLCDTFVAYTTAVGRTAP